MPLALRDSDVRPLSVLFKALGDETRLRIVALLTHGELCVCHLQAGLEVSQPNVSRHLAVLRAAGVVDARRDGSWIYYRLAEQADLRASQLEALTKTFVKKASLRRDVIRLLASTGPGSCD